MLRFVPENVGFQSITREEYIRDHVTDFSNRLYNETPEEQKAVIYNDCSYLYIEKSLCFKALRRSFCVHKGRHALKPAMFIAPNGHIFDIHRPYYSNAANSDDRLLLSQFELDSNGMREWLKNGDIFVLNCAYREVIAILERVSVISKMPSLLRPNESRLSTQEANHSRIVTKTRWIVEARNGHLKSIFKYFANVIKTAYIPSLNNFLLRAGAIINKYFDEISMPDADEHLAEEILNRYEDVNVVQARVDAENLTRRRGRWVRFTANHLPLLPRLPLQYLYVLTIGTYQVHLSPSYIQDSTLRAPFEDVDEEVDQLFEIDQRTDEPGFTRLRISSRYRNATQYNVWIAFNEEYNEDQYGDEPILGFYCTCRSGARTLGTCTYITAIVWYLAYARHEENVSYPSLRVLQTVQSVAMDISDIEIIDPLNNN